MSFGLAIGAVVCLMLGNPVMALGLAICAMVAYFYKGHQE